MGELILTPKAALEFQREQRIGAVLVENGMLDDSQLQEILLEQPILKCKFGEAAVQLGFLTQHDVEFALAKQFNYAVMEHATDLLGSRELVSAFQPFGPEAESFRALRSQLMLRCFERGRRALAVVSPVSSSGSTYVATNIAVTLAQLGVNVCLVDSNLRAPRIHEILQPSAPNLGLSDLLRGRATQDQVISTEQFPGLAIIFAGRVPPNPQELLSGGAFVEFVSQILREFEVVIFDTPATNTCADGCTIAARVGCALMVTHRHHTLVNDALILTEQLHDSGCEIVGSVINDF